MSQEALFAPATHQSPTNLPALARKKVEYLREAGALGAGAEFEAALLIDLATSYTQTKAGYARAQMARVLIDALGELLPSAEVADLWDTITAAAAALVETGDYGPPATYATRPTAGAPHQLAAVRLIAALLGRPLMPWQCQVARVATERTADGTRWRYPVIVVTVPRQSGKTTLLRALYTTRAMLRPDTAAWMTAQTGKDAAERWRDTVRDLSRSILAPHVDTKLSAGGQVLTFLRTNSTIRPFSPKAQALHGYTTTDAAIDEAFAFDDVQGRDLMGSVGPTMATVDDSQLIILSTAGNPESTWLRDWVNRGRSAVRDPDATLAYFEWSSPTSDPYAPEALDFHPAADRTVSRDKLQAEAAAQPITEWRRAYLNQWVDSAADPLMPAEVWPNLANPDQPQPAAGAPIGLAYELAVDGSAASLVAVWADETGQAHQRTINTAPGYRWLLDAIPEALATLGPAAELVADDGGANPLITDDLTKAGVPVRLLGAREFARACGGWYARAKAGTIDHPPTPAGEPDPVAAGIAVAQTRAISDAWAISRTHSAGPVHTLVAGMVALRVVDTTPDATPLEIVTG